MKRSHRIMLLALSLLAGIAVTSQSRIWRVDTMGTGDAPTLEAAMDSTAAGDTVLVAPGTYNVGFGLGVPAHVTLVSESGPVGCVLEAGEAGTPFILTMREGTCVSGFTLGWAVLANIFVHPGEGQEISYNIIPNGASDAIDLNNAYATVHHNTIIDGAIYQPGYSLIFYNILLGAVDCDNGDYGCNLVSVNNPCQGSLNFGADPLFCDPGNYYLRSDSPALPENSPIGCSSFLGALPMGCQVVPVETHTWGSVKALYRGEED